MSVRREVIQSTPQNTSISEISSQPRRYAANDIALPDVYKRNPRVGDILSGLLQRGYAVVDAVEGDVRERAMRQFDDYIDTLLDTDEEAGRFLLDNHPAWDVNWLGYVRHIIGPMVKGKSVLPPRQQPRGVNDRSGRR